MSGRGYQGHSRGGRGGPPRNTRGGRGYRGKRPHSESFQAPPVFKTLSKAFFLVVDPHFICRVKLGVCKANLNDTYHIWQVFLGPHRLSMFHQVYLNPFRPEEMSIFHRVKIWHEIRIVTTHTMLPLNTTMYLRPPLLPRHPAITHLVVGVPGVLELFLEDPEWNIEAGHLRAERAEEQQKRCLPYKDWDLKCLKRFCRQQPICKLLFIKLRKDIHTLIIAELIPMWMINQKSFALIANLRHQLGRWVNFFMSLWLPNVVM